MTGAFFAGIFWVPGIVVAIMGLAEPQSNRRSRRGRSRAVWALGTIAAHALVAGIVWAV